MTRDSGKLNRRRALGMLVGALLVPGASVYADTPLILVHKNPNCGCCGRWVEHLTAAGFAVKVQEANDLATVRKRLGVPSDLAACHTAEIAGYVIEGHVPAFAIRQLLDKRPDAVGLAVPGMPVGSPGMEGGTPKKYEVVLFGKAGRQPFMYFVGTQVVG